MSFADNLRRVRKNHDLSQEELAKLLYVSRQALSKWEQGVMLE
ncbi:helix-turn-helix transcriptional regulator [Thomasclavelia spiroformis]|nr:helix-turn-helix transcriptional regulator [Thomasclavelia spiroformis]